MLGNQRQDFFDGRNHFTSELGVEPTTGIKLAYFLQRQVSNFAGPIGGSVHGVIVDADQMPILRALHVELEAQTQFETSSEVRQRVLWSVLEQATMSDDQWAGRFLSKCADVDGQKQD